MEIVANCSTNERKEKNAHMFKKMEGSESERTNILPLFYVTQNTFRFKTSDSFKMKMRIEKKREERNLFH